MIAGYHWQSDVDAGRLAASVLYAKLQGNERFREELANAQKEFAEKKGSSTRVKEVKMSARNTARAYTINGTPATSETRGIVIQDNRKVIRR